MSGSDFEKIERSLDVKLPQDYKEIFSHYSPTTPKILEIYLSPDKRWIIKQNKMVRKAQNSSCPRKDWPSEYFVIGEDGRGNRYYINLQQPPSPVYLLQREHPDLEQQAAPNLSEWVSQVTRMSRLLEKDLPNEETRCPRCQLLGGTEYISTRKMGYKILDSTEYTTTYMDRRFTKYKCRFCRHRWEEDDSRRYVDVDYP